MFLTFDNEDTDAICKTAIDDKTGEEYKLTCLQQMQEKLCYKDNFFECSGLISYIPTRLIPEIFLSC